MVYSRSEVPQPGDYLDRLWCDNQSVFVGRQTQVSTGNTNITIMESGSKGQVLLVTKLMMAAQHPWSTPALDCSCNLKMYDGAGDLARTLPILLFGKDLTAPMDLPNVKPVVWEPRLPLIVPSGWSIKVNQTGGTTSQDAPHVVAGFGIRMDENEARSFGYNIDDDITSDPDKWGWIQNGAMPATGDAIEIAVAKAGKYIEITDIWFRMQPDGATGGTFTLQDIDAADGTTTKDIFRWDYNANNQDGIEHILKPRIFIDINHGLQVVAEDDAIGRSSIIVIGRYVNEKPGNAWWEHVSHANPTTLKSQQMSPEIVKGSFNIIEGFDVNIANGGTNGLTVAGIMTAPEGTTPNPLSFASPVAPIPPLMGLYGANTNFDCYISEVNMPLPDAHDVWAQATGVSPQADAVNFTVWGRHTNSERSFLGKYMGRSAD